MKKPANMHMIDRVVRLIVGVSCTYIGLADAALIANEIVSTAVGIFGVVNIYAFFTARCPVYSLARFSTASRPEQVTSI